jgi:hypothetical protein
MTKQLSNPTKQATTLFHSYINTVCSLFYRVGFQVITFPAAVMTILHTETVTVYRAYHVTFIVYKTISHDTAGMWAFIGKGI